MTARQKLALIGPVSRAIARSVCAARRGIVVTASGSGAGLGEPISVKIPEAVRLTGISRSRIYELMRSGDNRICEGWKLDTDPGRQPPQLHPQPPSSSTEAGAAF